MCGLWPVGAARSALHVWELKAEGGHFQRRQLRGDLRQKRVRHARAGAVR